jgi:hypothetical protein
VLDNFYPEPDKLRSIALETDFSVTGNFPGRRTEPYLDDAIVDAIADAVREPIRDWHEDISNGAFQSTTCRDRTWIHADLHNNWAGVLYLTPNAPPLAGTSFYKHIDTGYSIYPDDEGLRDKCDSDSQDYAKWVKLDLVANVYNRLILFRAKQFHASEMYFGNDLETGRLFQTFFFNTGQN